MQTNDYVASIMWTNRELLKHEMSLDDEDIIDLPIMYFGTPAIPLWPSPINGLTIGNHYILSCPHGPKISGIDVIEQCYRAAFEGTGVVTHFIDIFEGYSQLGGDIHCGTNTVRHHAKLKK